jgi:hypothetical protein
MIYSEYLNSVAIVDSSNNTFGTDRPDGGISYAYHMGAIRDLSFVGSFSSYGNVYRGFQHGYWAENSVQPTYQTDGESSTVAPYGLRYNLDPDGIPRRAMGGYTMEASNNGNVTVSTQASQSLVGLPYATGSTSSPAYSNRPTILHRPFRSVAELGYVFRDTPWGDINFAYPESGDSALLDVFCVNEISNSNGLVAGRVNLNTRQVPVLAALISGAITDKDNSANATVTQPIASLLGSTLVARTQPAVLSATAQGPLLSRADLVGTWWDSTTPASTSATTSGTDLNTVANATPPTINPNNFFTGFSADIGRVAGVSGTSLAMIPRQRNSVMRGLVDAGTTRTWNLLIDLVAQSGRFPPNAPASAVGLGQFVVEGEKHYWLHVAIDRYTGQVIDSQLEVVKE